MTWNMIGLALLLAYTSIPLWAWAQQRLFATDFVTLLGAPAVWFLMLAGGMAHVASLANLWFEGLIVIPAAPLLLAFRLLCLDYIHRDASINSRVVAALSVGAVVIFRMMMPTMPE